MTLPFPILLWQVVWLSSDSFSSQAYFTSSLEVKYSSRCLTSSNITKHLLSEYPGRNNQATWIKSLNEQFEQAECEGQSFKREAKYITVNFAFVAAFWPDKFASLGNSTGTYPGRLFFFPLEFAEVSKGRKKRIWSSGLPVIQDWEAKIQNVWA